MRAIAVGAMAGAAAIAFAAPASARPTDVVDQLTATGSVSITWHGDRARGCAAAGLCGYRGSMVTQPGGGDGLLVLSIERRTLADSFGYFSFSEPPVVRVERDDERACVDLAPGRDMLIFADRVVHGRVRLSLAPYGLNAGRCAGPDASEMVERLPRPWVSLARLRRGGVTVPFTGRVPYSLGRYSGMVTSTLRLRLGRGDTGFQDESGGFGEPGRRARSRRVRFVRVRAVYRVTGLRGRLATTFHGLPEPFCAAVDSCGSTGASDWAILSVAGGTVVVEGEARAGPAAHGLHDGIAALRRGPSLTYAIGAFRHPLGATTADVRAGDGAGCHDFATAAAPGLQPKPGRRKVVFEFGGEGAYPTGGDLVRTGCPGPLQADVFGQQPVASAAIAPAAMLRGRLDLPLTGRGRFRAPGYAGKRRARFTLGLQRVSLRAHYRVATVRR